METKDTIIHNIQYLRQLVFEVTDSCNLNCGYCALSNIYERHEKRNGKRLSFNKARQIIDYILERRAHTAGTNYPLHISFYGGEPLLNFELIEQIVSYLNRPGLPEITFGMTTNGTLLNTHLDFLSEMQFRLVISLDGNVNNNSYRVYHSGKSSFQRVLTNVLLLKKKYPEYFQKHVMFNSVLHNRNSVGETFYFIKESFGKITQIAPLSTVGICNEKIAEFRQMYQNVNDSIQQSGNCEMIEDEMFSNAPRILGLANYIFKQSGNAFKCYNDLFYDSTIFSIRQTGTCSPFAKKMFITVNGKILQCERIAHDFSLGQVYDNTVEIDFEQIANVHNQHISKLEKQCEKCSLQKICPQCIYYIKGINGKAPQCDNFCDRKKYERLKKKTLDYLRINPEYYEKILNEVTIRY